MNFSFMLFKWQSSPRTKVLSSPFTFPFLICHWIVLEFSTFEILNSSSSYLLLIQQLCDRKMYYSNKWKYLPWNSRILRRSGKSVQKNLLHFFRRRNRIFPFLMKNNETGLRELVVCSNWQSSSPIKFEILCFVIKRNS